MLHSQAQLPVRRKEKRERKGREGRGKKKERGREDKEGAGNQNSEAKRNFPDPNTTQENVWLFR